MYALLQAELGHIGRFQKGTNNVLCFIIPQLRCGTLIFFLWALQLKSLKQIRVSDIEGIKSIIQLVPFLW